MYGRACRTIFINPSCLVGLAQVRERTDADPAQEGEVHQHPHRHRRRLPRLPLLQAASVREWRPNNQLKNEKAQILRFTQKAYLKSREKHKIFLHI